MSGDMLQEIDITKIILDTVNSLCSTMLDSVDATVYPLLDKLIFVDATIVKDSYFENLFGLSPTSGILILANCLLFAFLLYYSIRLLISHFSGVEVESPQRFIFRTIIATFFMNTSLELCQFILNSAHQISSIFLELGKDTLNKEISFLSLQQALQSTSSSSFTIFSLDGILSSTLSISAFAMLTTFALRYILIKLLVLVSPFAFLCASNQSTEGFLKSWYRSFLSLLFVQIIISILLIFSHAILKQDANSLLNKLLLIGTISALLKSGQFIKEFFGGIGISSNFQSGISGLKSMFSR